MERQEGSAGPPKCFAIKNGNYGILNLKKKNTTKIEAFQLWSTEMEVLQYKVGCRQSGRCGII